MNDSLEVVTMWVKSCELKLSMAKTEAVILTTKKAFEVPKSYLEVTKLEMKTEIKYLGMTLRKTLRFIKQLTTTGAKAAALFSSLYRLFPNLEYLTQRKIQLLMTAVHSKLLYAAPV